MAKEKTCPGCGQRFEKKERYCTSCGCPLINRCMFDGGPAGDPCGHINPPEAAYCEKCGSRTAFAQAGLLPAPHLEKKTLEEDDFSEFSWFEHPFFHF
jgi:hypothetical protein